MRCWRASRSQAFNEATVVALLKWRRDVRLIQELHNRRLGYAVADGVVPLLGELLTFKVHNACAPVLQTLERLEKSFAALGRG